jgi:hypothetical protein
MPWSKHCTQGPATTPSCITAIVACNLSIRYTERLAEAGIERSVGTVGDSYDNALAETIIGLYKTEVIRRRGPWRHIDAVEFATLSWVDWFNNRRLLEPLGYLPPAEFEAAYYRCQSTPAMVAVTCSPKIGPSIPPSCTEASNGQEEQVFGRRDHRLHQGA